MPTPVSAVSCCEDGGEWHCDDVRIVEVVNDANTG
jgi:hypothetical protein